MINAIFCDMDGTLVDTRRANFVAYKNALAQFDLVFTQEQFTDSWGKDSRDFLPELYPDLSLTDIEQVRDLKALEYVGLFAETRVNTALLELLLTFRSQGVQVLLVTTAKRRSLLPLLDFHALRGVFDHIVSGDDVSSGKPHPEPYLKALSLAECSASGVLAIEDSEEGISSAEQAGISVLRIAFGELE